MPGGWRAPGRPDRYNAGDHPGQRAAHRGDGGHRVAVGHLELIANKRDFDFTITPYELTAGGQYFQMPPYHVAASHVGSLTERRLLTPGRVERLDFASILRMVSRRMARAAGW